MVSDSTLVQDIWTTVRNTLANNIYVVNSATTTTVMATVVAAYNDKINPKPQVVVYPVSYDEANYKFAGGDWTQRNGRKVINIDIECYAGNSEFVDQMDDQIRQAMSELYMDGIDLTGITSNYVFNDYNQNKYHTKGFTFTYVRE